MNWFKKWFKKTEKFSDGLPHCFVTKEEYDEANDFKVWNNYRPKPE